MGMKHMQNKWAKHNNIISQVLLVLAPAFGFIMFETISGNFKTIVENDYKIVLLNLCIWYLLYAVVFAITNHGKYTIWILNTATYILAVANAFVVQFRAQPIMIMDAKTFWTAASVANEYTYKFSAEMIIMLICVLIIHVAVFKWDFKIEKVKWRVGNLLCTICITVFSFYGMLFGNWFLWAGSANLDFFRFNFSYQTDGYAVCTVKTINYLRVEPPEGYSYQKVEELAGAVEPSADITKDLPENVIVIMNESFSDLSVLGEFAASEPLLPYYNSLKEEAVQGKVYASVFGGSTANSEFEFLTGNTMAFMPNGTVPYQMYVEPGDSSLVETFEKEGYKTIMYHPFKKNNYNREKVYDIYGFDAYYGIDDMKVKRKRKYATDMSDYQNLIKLVEQKEAGEKLFIFNITMQNHSGYNNKKYKSTVSLTECPGKFPETEQYLSLLQESDAALKYLLEYFSKSDEKTVILFFGDHQPKLEDGFYEMVMGPTTEEKTFEYMQKQHMVPYMLWANYDLKKEKMQDMSINYLGSYLMQSVGIEMPAYNRYLLELQKTIPAINIYGYQDKDGNLCWIGNLGEYEEILNEYHMFQYNNLFDNKHRLHELYE